jgi:hypothetical protein
MVLDSANKESEMSKETEILNIYEVSYSYRNVTVGEHGSESVSYEYVTKDVHAKTPEGAADYVRCEIGFYDIYTVRLVKKGNV